MDYVQWFIYAGWILMILGAHYQVIKYHQSFEELCRSQQGLVKALFEDIDKHFMNTLELKGENIRLKNQLELLRKDYVMSSEVRDIPDPLGARSTQR